MGPEADLTQVIPMLVDGIAQEIGAERRDMRVTFVANLVAGKSLDKSQFPGFR